MRRGRTPPGGWETNASQGDPHPQGTYRTAAAVDMMEVLLVTPEDAVRQQLEGAVRDRGHRVSCEPDGARALRLAQESEFHFIILDQAHGGVALARRMQKIPNREEGIIIMVSATDGLQDLKEALEAGVDDYLPRRLETQQLGLRLTIAEQRAENRRWRRQALERLQLSASILESVRNLVLVSDIRGRIIYASPSVTTELGYRPEEVLGEDWPALVSVEESTQARSQDYLCRAARGEIPIHPEPYEARLLDRSGQLHTVLWQDAQGPGGTVIGIGSILREKELLEEARVLRRRERSFRALLEATCDLVLVLSREARVSYASPSSQEILGLPPQELVGQVLLELVEPEDRSLCLLLVESALTSTRPDSPFQLRLLHTDGTWRTLEILAGPLSEQEQDAVVFSARDVTERSRAFAELKRSEQNHRAIFQMATDAILILDLDTGKILEANPRAMEIFGRSRRELVGQLVGTVTPAFTAEWRRVRGALGKSITHTFETTHQRPGGGEMLLEITTSGVDHRGRKAVLAMHRDITVRKRIEVALQRSEIKYQTLFNHIPNPVLIYDDRSLLFLDCNQAVERTYGYTREEILTLRPMDLHAPEEREELQLRLHQPTPAEGVAYTHQTRDGRRIQVEIISRQIEYQDRPAWIAIIRDVTQRRQAEEALRVSRERFELATRGATDGLWDWDLESDRVYYAPRWWQMLGYDDQTAGEAPADWFKLVHPHDLVELRAEIDLHLQGSNPHLEVEYRILHQDGDYRWMLCRGLAVRDEQGRAYRLAGSQTDITLRRRAEERLLHDGLHDSLTGLPNRALFLDRLERAIQLARRRSDYRFAVLMLDLDRFKIINDSQGHATGDDLLVALAGRLEARLSPGDTVARLGGDEFCLLLEDISDPDAADQAVSRINGVFGDPFVFGGQEIFTSACIGVALYVPKHRSGEELLRDADLAMYRAKSRGKACHEVFDEDMHRTARMLFQLETDLRRALEHQEFFLQFQPIVSLETGTATGFEALLRWASPRRGQVPPLEFIALAEETGLIVPIGAWALQEACQAGAEWVHRAAADQPCTVAVNLSSKQLTDPGLLPHLERVLEETGFPASCLGLEITESALVEHSLRIQSLLAEIKRLGIHLTIDDFGTGYSSLSYLHRFPADALKIDRSFVSRMDRDENALEIIRTIMDLTSRIGMDVIAEGVERTAQVELLQQLGCRLAQGYHFARALDQQLILPLVTGEVPPWRLAHLMQDGDEEQEEEQELA